DRLLIETDSPYLIPRNLKPKPKTRRNEPKYLPHIAAYIAQQINLSTEELVALTTENSKTFFNI
ncbi:Uncharacterized metal-dependent hydrolase YcfH, partial [hydrothermal vent metagenome]